MIFQISLKIVIGLTPFAQLPSPEQHAKMYDIQLWLAVITAGPGPRI